MYVGDVGQGNWEEVNFEAASSSGRPQLWLAPERRRPLLQSLYGMRITHRFDRPFVEYSHSEGCSVTGGYVYRGCAVPDLNGTYFYGDYCQGTIWSLNYDGSTVTDFQDRTAELGLGSIQVSSFGEDWNGELYIVHYGGTIYKIVPMASPPHVRPAHVALEQTGNVNVVGSIESF